VSQGVGVRGGDDFTLRVTAAVRAPVAPPEGQGARVELAFTTQTGAAAGDTVVVPLGVLDLDVHAALTNAGVSGPIRIAGNLPYNISSPILFRLLALASERPVKDATLMLQREVADRIAASPGTPEYGVLSVLMQWRTDVERLLTIPPGAFRPPPDVRSALIRLTFRTSSVAVKDPALFERMVRSMFTQRRKTLANALAAFGQETAANPAQVLVRAGIDPRRRAETLEIVEIARLADHFATAKR
jgi:16S rRNA (adenine1518-N6/adenine1519-N6)-dimethyltransferase